MAVTHFDIDDQWNPQNLAAAKAAHEQDLQWEKTYGKEFKGYKYICNLPEDEDAAIEVD